MSTYDLNPFELGSPEPETLVEAGLSCRVILFNDDWHTFDEVIEQIIVATRCSYEHAEQCTLEVHHLGKAMVFEGQLDECIRVSSILEEIALLTQLEM
jgi:ATP-dependent Clp protease adaptor protein ClpS